MKNSSRITLLITMFCASFAVQSGDMNPMKKMMLQQMMAPCEDGTFLSCIGIDKKKCVSAVKKAIASCDNLFPTDMSAMSDDTMNAHGDCVGNNIIKNAGINQGKLDNCEASNSTSAPPMEQEQMMAMMGQALQAHAAAVGTDGVTLPLYKNATVMSHFANGEMAQMFEDVEQLPALMMASPDSSDKIVKYYRKKLEGFTEYKIEDGILFMENGPEDFDLLKNMRTYVSTPHVAVINDAASGVPGAKSRIEIAYRKK